VSPAEFSRGGRRRDFSLFGVLIILSRVWPVGIPGNPYE
jgi:hypothetical protein